MTKIKKENSLTMSSKRKSEVRAIFRNTMRYISKLSAGTRKDLVTLHPYNAGTSKNYLAEALRKGKGNFCKKYNLFTCSERERKIFKSPKAYWVAQYDYFDDKKRQKTKAEIKDGMLMMDNNPLHGNNFIFGANRDGNIYIADRTIKIYQLSDDEYQEKGLQKYPVTQFAPHSAILEGKAGICFGCLEIENGKVTKINNKTGHYRCNLEHLCNLFNKTDITQSFSEQTVIENLERDKEPEKYKFSDLQQKMSEVAQKW